MTETEYVGRVINSEGWKYSDEKKAKVLNSRKPQRLGELKKFIGLCEYFHTYIKNFTEIMKPLYESPYGNQKKFCNTRFHFTDAQSAAYTKIQQEITQSATMYFVDEHACTYHTTNRCIRLRYRGIHVSENEWDR